MRAYGLTGNIACGKSTVSKLLAKLPGVLCIDTDSLAKQVIASGMVRKEIVAILEKNVYSSTLPDYKAIANIIFIDSRKKIALEALIHPIVLSQVNEQVEQASESTICIVESAIIFESEIESNFLGVIVATCNKQEQFRRLRTNRNMNDAEIWARIASQIPVEEKEARANFVIHTDCGLDELEQRVANLYIALVQENEKERK